jgi:outer membrane translocation and assembly module TamA
MVVAYFSVGCEATRHVDGGQLLLERHPSFHGNSAEKAEVLKTAIRTRPNKRILTVRLFLQLYNAGKSLEVDSSFAKQLYHKLDRSRRLEANLASWLKQIAGEPPVLISPKQLVEDCQNLESYYFSRGFFDAQVRYEIIPSIWSSREGRVIFHIREGPVRRLNEVELVAASSGVHQLLLAHWGKSKLKAGSVYKEEDFTSERNRIAELLRNGGYFNFSPKQIEFEVDTSLQASDLNPELRHLHSQTATWVNVRVLVPDSSEVYRISRVQVRLRYFFDDELHLRLFAPENHDSLSKALKISRSAWSRTNTTEFVTDKRYLRTLNLNTIHDYLAIRSNDLFSARETREAQRRLQELGMFRNIVFGYLPNDSLKSLMCLVDLSLAKRFDYRIGVESFQTEQFSPSANLPGVGINLQLGVKNALRRGERLRISANANLNFYSPDDNTELQIYSQVGAAARIDVPRFLALESFAKSARRKGWLRFVSPNTSFSLNYSRQRPLEFLRNSLSMRLRYDWFHSDEHVTAEDRQVRSELTPIDLTLVNSELDPEFRQRILGEDTQLSEFLLVDFRQRITLFSSYYRSYSDRYSLLRNRATTLFRFGAEIGGNLPFLIDRFSQTLGLSDQNFKDQILTIGPYSYGYGQFVRLSAEARWFGPMGQHREFVARALVGAARGWNHTILTPFENRFFTGGTNSVRGWQSNTLGPGTFKATSGSRIITLGGEYKLELNAELRQDVYSPLELALFLDVGNVWLSDRGDFIAEGSALDFRDLQLGIAGGVGIRIDLSYFVMRLDLGQQIYAPDIQTWVIRRFPRDIGFPRLQYNLAIGYPF